MKYFLVIISFMLLMINPAAAEGLRDGGIHGVSVDTIGAQPLDPALTSISGLTLTAGDLIYATAADTYAVLDHGEITEILVGGGVAVPVWTTATGTGAPVKANTPTLITPNIGAAVSSSINNSEGNITNVGDIALDTISSDASTGISINLGAGANDNLLIDANTVGIDTVSPDRKLHLAHGSAVYIRLENLDTTLGSEIIGAIEFEQQDASAPGVGVAGSISLYADAAGGSTYMVFSSATTAGLDQEAMRLDETGDLIMAVGGIVPDFRTSDPCGSFPEGSIFYNDTANVLCFCDGTNDLKISDGSACF